jgi:hypothetical protein
MFEGLFQPRCGNFHDTQLFQIDCAGASSCKVLQSGIGVYALLLKIANRFWREAISKLIGLSPWSIRQRLIPEGLPHFRSGANGKLVFYRNQVEQWIVRRQQLNGGTKM